MKKIFFLAAAALATLTLNAHTLNNPVGEDGRYIVKYDCEQGKWAESNDMEIDEAFTFAVDVTGTWLADFLKGAPTAAGASRGVACNFWTSRGDVNGDIKRFKQIDGNIWGMTISFAQAKADAADFSESLKRDSILYIYGQVFCFEYTADDPGVGWWMWGDAPVEETRADGADCFFTTAPYTGKKTSQEFYGDEVGDGIYGFALAGYAAPCAVVEPLAIENVTLAPKAQKVIENGQIILINNGVRYNALGSVIE